MDISSKLLEYRKIGVLGLGISGLACCNFFLKNNIPFVAFDDNFKAKSKFIDIFSEDRFVDYNDWDDLSHIIMSPGIPLTGSHAHKIVDIARKKNIKLISDYEILYHLKKEDSKFIAITGTNGKSTVSSMIYHILNSNGYNVSLGGNIGVSVLDLDLSSDIYVLELSSFQLELLQNFKPDIALILNITEDHIDRHLSMEKYIESKFNIFKNQSNDDSLILGNDGMQLSDLYKKFSDSKNKVSFSLFEENLLSDSYISENKIYFKNEVYNLLNEIISFPEIKKINFLSSFIASRIIGLNAKDIISSILTFKDLNHRMQFLGKIKNCNIYNDSKATNADSVLPTVKTLNNIFWIAGGISKSSGIKPLLEHLSNVECAYFIGDSKDRFEGEAKDIVKNIKKYNILQEAFENALLDAILFGKECNIILSPAAASYDMYKNFEERGSHFIDIFNSFKKNHVE